MKVEFIVFDEYTTFCFDKTQLSRDTIYKTLNFRI
jgi:hypothetical protein